METVIRHYIRDERKNPIGVVVASNDNGTIKYGWSKWHLDSTMPWLKFDKELGISRAMHRMENDAPLPRRGTEVIPEADWEAIITRAQKYFKLGQYSPEHSLRIEYRERFLNGRAAYVVDGKISIPASSVTKVVNKTSNVFKLKSLYPEAFDLAKQRGFTCHQFMTKLKEVGGF